MRRSMLGVAIVWLLVPVASATAAPPRAGFLECLGGRSVGYIVGSIASLDCVYRSHGRPAEAYIATIRRFGLDLGVTEQTRFAWAVSAPASRFERGELAGTYGGVGASASVGVGFGGNFLVGGRVMPMRCSRSACRARPVSTSQPASPESSSSRSCRAEARPGSAVIVSRVEAIVVWNCRRARHEPLAQSGTAAATVS